MVLAPPPPTPGRTLKALPRPAPETDEEATARHLRMCRRLAELGMGLAEAAAREAERNLEAPIEYPMPGTALPPLCRTADPGLLFARLSRAVRQTIALEARIRNESLEARSRTVSPPPRIRPDALDQRRPATPPPRPPRPRDPFRPDPDECLHDEFADDHSRPVPEIVANIRRDLNLPPEKAARQRKPGLHATTAPPASKLPAIPLPSRRPAHARPRPHPD